MRKRILIMTECSSDIGFGHLTRCQSLANAFRNVGWDACLWVAADEATRIHLPAGALSIDWHCLLCDAAAELRRADAVLIDSQIATITQIEHIAEINPKIAILDDWNRRVYKTGIVIDWTIGAESFAYTEKSANVLYLLGSQYCSMREEFEQVPQRYFADLPKEILLTFGGSDIRQLTVPVLSKLNDAFPNLHKNIVVGGGVQDKSFVDEMPYPNTTIHIACAASKMRMLMSQSDLAICAGGQTLYELASQGLPPLVIGVADDQRDDIQGFEKAGFALVIGDWNMPNLFHSLTAAVRTLWPEKERRCRSAIGRRSVDGYGAQRLVAACLEHWRIS